MAVGIAMPGLADSLKVRDEELDTDVTIPEYVELTADVENFSLNMTMTMVLSDILSGLQLDEGVDMSGLGTQAPSDSLFILFYEFDLRIEPRTSSLCYILSPELRLF